MRKIVIQKSKETDKKLLPVQQGIVDDFCKDYESGIRKTYLLHGVTGSGKTEVYIECNNTPLYSFGYGLSYSNFVYEDLTLS